MSVTHTKQREIQYIVSKCTTRRDFPSRRNTGSTKGECGKPMRERPQGLRPTRLNSTRARSTYRLSCGHANPIRADARSDAQRWVQHHSCVLEWPKNRDVCGFLTQPDAGRPPLRRPKPIRWLILRL